MLIGVSGKIGAGKDVIGSYLQYEHGYDIIKFADKIKDIASMITNTDPTLHKTQEGKQTYLEEWGMTIREFQQKLGTEAMRNGLHPDTWVIATLSHYKPKYRWVVTDVRFKNEADSIINRGGILIRVERPDNPFPQSNHSSELELDSYPFKYRIINDGTLNDLYEKTEEQLKGLLS